MYIFASMLDWRVKRVLEESIKILEYAGIWDPSYG